MSAYRVARRYAEAALELAEEQKQGERLADDLEMVWKAIKESPEFLALLKSPVISKEKKLAVFTGIERAKFRRQVTPGDQLRIEVDVLAFKTRVGRMEAKAFVDGKLACQATLTCAIVPRVREPEPASAEPAAETETAE